MSGNGIETRLVCGFLDAGKTHYINDCIRNDRFHRYGTPLKHLTVRDEGFTIE